LIAQQRFAALAVSRGGALAASRVTEKPVRIRAFPGISPARHRHFRAFRARKCP
jgi:hypothetical protein